MSPIAAFAVAAAIGCGSSDFGNRDAGAAADAGPYEPVAPAVPVLTPCPKGWREVTDPVEPDIVTCDPWPASGRETCAADSAHFPGEPGCRPIGSPCPPGDFPEVPAGARVVYVRAGAVGGDGTLASPLGTITEGITAAEIGGIVALARGTFDELVTMRKSVTVLGACPAETTIASSAPSESRSTVTFTAPEGARLENVRISGERGGIAVEMGDPVEIASVIIEGTVANAINAYAGRVVATDVVVRDVRIDVTGDRGYGIEIWRGGEVELARVVVENAWTNAVFVDEPGSELHATDLVVRGTRARPIDGDFGVGLMVQQGAHADVARVVLEDNEAQGLVVRRPDTGIVARDLFVRDAPQGDVDPRWGQGIEAIDGAAFDFARTTIELGRQAGLVVAGAGTDGTFADAVVRDGGGRVRGIGAAIQDGGHVRMSRVAILRGRSVGILVAYPGTELSADDLVVRGTQEQRSDANFGDGIEVHTGATLTLTRADVSANRRFGILVAHGGAAATLTDVVVEGTQEAACSETDGCIAFGSGVTAKDTAVVRMSSFRSSDNALCGLQVASESEVDLSIGVVSGNAIGANVQIEGYDIGRLQDRVIYVDNDQTLDSQALPLPEVIGSIGG